MPNPTKKQKVLLFNERNKLAAMFDSAYQTSLCLQTQASSITKACQGELMTVKGYGFRYLNPDIVIEADDFGSLGLEEYDNLCGIKRKVRKYSKYEVARKRRCIRKRIQSNGNQDY